MTPARHGLPMHRQIEEQLRADIEAGRYAPGEAIPSEAQLCAMWEVSRGPVRHAVASLATQGYVRKSQGRPTTVRIPPIGQRVDTYTPFSQWARSQRRRYGQRTISLTMHMSEPEQAERLGVRPGDRILDMVRLRLLDGMPTMIERSSFTDEVGTLLLKFDLDSDGISDYLTECGIHYGVVEQTVDAIAADELDARWLEVAPGAPLLRVRRTAAGDDGVVWEYSDDRYRPDLMTFNSSFRRSAADAGAGTPGARARP